MTNASLFLTFKQSCQKDIPCENSLWCFPASSRIVFFVPLFSSITVSCPMGNKFHMTDFSGNSSYTQVTICSRTRASRDIVVTMCSMVLFTGKASSSSLSISHCHGYDCHHDHTGVVHTAPQAGVTAQGVVAAVTIRSTLSLHTPWIFVHNAWFAMNYLILTKSFQWALISLCYMLGY